MIPRLASLTLVGAGLLCSLISCSSKSAMPVIDLGKLFISDSVLLVDYMGDEGRASDSLRMPLQGDALCPDTSRYNLVLVASRSQVVAYTLQGGRWRQTQRPDTLGMARSVVSSYSSLSGLDAWGKTQTIYQPSDGHHRLLLLFVPPEGSIPSAWDKLASDTARRDSLTLVYLDLNDSQKAARKWGDKVPKRGRSYVFSDSLGLVSATRELYGLSRSASTVVLEVDSMGTVRRAQP